MIEAWTAKIVAGSVVVPCIPTDRLIRGSRPWDATGRLRRLTQANPQGPRGAPAEDRVELRRRARVEPGDGGSRTDAGPPGRLVHGLTRSARHEPGGHSFERPTTTGRSPFHARLRPDGCALRRPAGRYRCRRPGCAVRGADRRRRLSAWPTMRRRHGSRPRCESSPAAPMRPTSRSFRGFRRAEQACVSGAQLGVLRDDPGRPRRGARRGHDPDRPRDLRRRHHDQQECPPGRRRGERDRDPGRRSGRDDRHVRSAASSRPLRSAA